VDFQVRISDPALADFEGILEASQPGTSGEHVTGVSRNPHSRLNFRIIVYWKRFPISLGGI
jgi:hypothetical protein